MEYAGFWRRVGAYIIDVIIISIVSGIIGGIFGVGLGVGMAATGGTAEDLQSGANALGGLIGLGIGILYFCGMESSSMQATLGKKALGLVVTDVNGNRIGFGKALGRYLGKILSSLILGIGYLMVAFTEKKQGLHDMLAGTLVLIGQPGQTASASAFE